MKIHVITAFSRWHLYDTLKKMYDIPDVMWHPLVDKNKVVVDKTQYPEVIEVDNMGEIDGAYCYRKTNRFIETQKIIDDDYYMFMCDDDALDNGFIDWLKTQTAEILVVSCLRGDQTPIDGACPHGTSTLIAARQNMCIGNCTWEQLIVKGKILKDLRFDEVNCCADGQMLNEVAMKYQNITFVPDRVIKFNYFQPGRWNEYNG